ncbi:MAG: hypothetical protein RL318_2899 [Fibrobacterota bacterium]|jgi:hypothetical protein
MSLDAPSPDPEKPPKQAAPAKRRNRAWLLLLLLLLLLVGTCSFWPRTKGGVSGSSPSDSLQRVQAREDSLRKAALDSARQDSLARLAMLESMRADSLRIDSLMRSGSARQADSLLRIRRHLKDSLATLQRRLDSLTQARESARTDSLRRLDSLNKASQSRRPPPYVVADPAGGVHPAPVDVAVLTLSSSVTPLCALEDSSKLAVCRNLVRIDRDRVLWISAVDSFGTRAPAQRLAYHIDPDASKCGPKRALVPMPDGKPVCVDAYEYPNEPRQLPRTSVTWEEASALCARQNKRLCLREELTQACQGPEGWKYPYGPQHRTNHCQDGGTGPSRGHDHPGCRSWWGAYNVAGNAWEWTASKQGNAVWAFGGFFSQGPSASCQESKRSFFPQNKYSSVGFRCCEDAP